MTNKPNSKEPQSTQTRSVNKGPAENQQVKATSSSVRTPPTSGGKLRAEVKKPSLSRKPARRRLEPNRLAWGSGNLFEMIGSVSYIALIGTFFAAFILFLVLVILKPLVVFSNFTFYTAIGLVVYTISFLLWKFATKPKVGNTSDLAKAKVLIQQNYKKRLLAYLIGTSAIYFLVCWFMMIMLGSFNGFGIKFIDNPQIGAFGEIKDLNQMRIHGYILFYVFFFVFLISFLIFWVFTNWKKEANKILTKRRKMIAQVNVKAQESI